jgi:hypothetical protein
LLKFGLLLFFAVSTESKDSLASIFSGLIISREDFGICFYLLLFFFLLSSSFLLVSLGVMIWDRDVLFSIPFSEDLNEVMKSITQELSSSSPFSLHYLLDPDRPLKTKKRISTQKDFKSFLALLRGSTRRPFLWVNQPQMSSSSSESSSSAVPSPTRVPVFLKKLNTDFSPSPHTLSPTSASPSSSGSSGSPRSQSAKHRAVLRDDYTCKFCCRRREQEYTQGVKTALKGSHICPHSDRLANVSPPSDLLPYVDTLPNIITLCGECHDLFDTGQLWIELDSSPSASSSSSASSSFTSETSSTSTSSSWTSVSFPTSYNCHLVALEPSFGHVSECKLHLKKLSISDFQIRFFQFHASIAPKLRPKVQPTQKQIKCPTCLELKLPSPNYLNQRCKASTKVCAKHCSSENCYSYLDGHGKKKLALKVLSYFYFVQSFFLDSNRMRFLP